MYVYILCLCRGGGSCSHCTLVVGLCFSVCLCFSSNRSCYVHSNILCLSLRVSELGVGGGGEWLGLMHRGTCSDKAVVEALM